jgi:hypothetical protein
MAREYGLQFFMQVPAISAMAFPYVRMPLFHVPGLGPVWDTKTAVLIKALESAVSRVDIHHRHTSRNRCLSRIHCASQPAVLFISESLCFSELVQISESVSVFHSTLFVSLAS